MNTSVCTETLATSVPTVPGPHHDGIDADLIAARARQQGSRSPWPTSPQPWSR